MIVFLLNEAQKENLYRFNVLARRGRYPVRELYMTEKKEIPEELFALSKIFIIDGTIKGYERYIRQLKKHSKALVVVMSDEEERKDTEDIIRIRMQEEEFENLLAYNYERMDRLQIGSYLMWEEIVIGYNGKVYGNGKRIYLSKQETRFFTELVRSRISGMQNVVECEKQKTAELVSRIRKKIEQIQLPCSILCRNNGVYEVWWS